MNIYSVLYSNSAHLEKYGNLKVVKHPIEMTTPGILLLHGGADISPSIYKHPISKYSQADIRPSSRDVTEIICARKAIKMGMPIYGICRGAQLLCALAGGSLVQHSTGHTNGNHLITTDDDQQLNTTSCHHQMMNLKNTEYQLKAWSTQGLSQFYLHENDKEIQLEKEPEVVIFPAIKALAIQGHPEWMDSKSKLVQYTHSLLEKELL